MYGHRRRLNEASLFNRRGLIMKKTRTRPPLKSVQQADESWAALASRLTSISSAAIRQNKAIATRAQ